MRDREWQIALFGTFDIENYGDLLFPLIAQAEMTERLGAVKLHRFSYHTKTPPDWPYAVTSVTELPNMVSRLDGVLIGGGFLIRFDKEVAPAYGPPTPMIHHPTGYWLTPALIALQNGIPLIWNAPGAFGMHNSNIPAWADPLMELAFSLSRYIAVRGKQSKAVLARFAGTTQINVVPDTAFGISRLLNERPSPEFRRLCNASGLNRPYIIIQAAHGLDFFLRFVKKHAHRLTQFNFLALPISPDLGDDAAILDADLPGFRRLPIWPHPLLIAELINQAVAVVGDSYHLMVTALASGVPVFTSANLSSRRFSGFLDFDTLFRIAEDSELDLGWYLGRLGKTSPSPAARAACDQLSEHWDRVADVLRAGNTATQPAVNRFWQSLPGLLETSAIRYDAALATLEAERAELHPQIEKQRYDLQCEVQEQTNVIAELEANRMEKQKRIDELNRVLALARSEIVSRDDRLARLYNSPSWKVTAPARFIMRNLKRLLPR